MYTMIVADKNTAVYSTAYTIVPVVKNSKGLEEVKGTFLDKVIFEGYGQIISFCQDLLHNLKDFCEMSGEDPDKLKNLDHIDIYNTAVDMRSSSDQEEDKPNIIGSCKIGIIKVVDEYPN